MTLEEQLKQVRDTTLTRMPQSIVQVFKDSIRGIRDDKLKEQALQVGDQIPEISLKSIEGNPVGLIDLFQSEFLILNFYRGGWCPYCNMELREYERLKMDFMELGVSIAAVSAETPELATQTIDKNSISYPILTDDDAKLMKAIGIVFKLDEASKREYVNFGMDFSEIHGNENYELPVPAVYVINRDMEIVFVHFEEDYMTRMEPTEVLNFIKTNYQTINATT